MRKLIRNPELRGILALLSVILVIGAILAAASGNLEKWFNITLFSGPRALDKIIFVSQRSGVPEVFLMNRDGSGQKQLTRGADVDGMPAISPTATRIVFVGRFGGNAQLFCCNSSGSTATQLTTATGPKACPSFSPDGKTLSYLASGKVYLADVNGESPHLLLPKEGEMQTAVTGRGEVPPYIQFVWGADGRSLFAVLQTRPEMESPVFLPELDGLSQAMPLAAGGVVRVPGVAAFRTETKFVFSANVGRDCLLALFDPAGESKPLLKVRNVELGAPCISPDGSEVAVPVNTAVGKVPAGLVLISPTVGTQRMIATGVFENPSYSPDGTTIVATQVGPGDSQDVVTIDPSSGTVTNLTTDGKSYSAIYTPESEKK